MDSEQSLEIGQSSMTDLPDAKIDIKSLNYEALQQYVCKLGEKKFRAGQLYQWMHEKLVDSYEEMTNLPKAFLKKLEEETEYVHLTPVEILTSKLDGTQKYLFRLGDGNVIESVLMKYHHGNSVCISSQVGCRMGCRFCASTIGGRIRDLRSSEMLDQVYQIQKLSGERVSNLVIMGTGEPLDNYDNVVGFIRMLTDDHGLNISQRNVTLSTCGIVPNILRLAQEGLQITLALSLHASNQEKRKTLMPVANKYELTDVLSACQTYFEKTGRRLTFEYSLVGGVNDTDEDARELTGLIKNLQGHVNLIPVNPVTERSFVSPDRSRVMAFKNKLERNGINATVRREMGRDINGACGQLRRSYMQSKEEEE